MLQCMCDVIVVKSSQLNARFFSAQTDKFFPTHNSYCLRTITVCQCHGREWTLLSSLLCPFLSFFSFRLREGRGRKEGKTINRTLRKQRGVGVSVLMVRRTINVLSRLQWCQSNVWECSPWYRSACSEAGLKIMLIRRDWYDTRSDSVWRRRVAKVSC